MIPLEPRPVGDPAAMNAFASELSRQAKALAAQADALHGRAQATTFEGPAGERFDDFMLGQRKRLHETAADLNDLANRVRAEANAVEASIAAWERHREMLIQQQIEAARQN